ncbi:CvpA family protein [Methylocaldum sp.]|uniref:CvpA family protein n=1 Tax=Methylocaldum sp. TaxID=1969727 RepID=UPI002D6EAD60|nr:CvpA family protein [Methylocaldum sp.]HYE36482.1 CvpA family protein [Methylocaldum sp.]
MPNLVWIDYCIVGIIGLSALIGLLRGLMREVFSLCAWISAAWIGLRFSRDFSVYLDSVISIPSARIAASFAVLFFASLILASLIGFLLYKLVQSTGLTGTDRLAGMVFGIGRGTIVVAVLVLLAGVTPLPEDPWWKESALIPPFQSLALWLRDQLPSDFGGYVKFR